jgi:hypothetical protein
MGGVAADIRSRRPLEIGAHRASGKEQQTQARDASQDVRFTCQAHNESVENRRVMPISSLFFAA